VCRVPLACALRSLACSLARFLTPRALSLRLPGLVANNATKEALFEAERIWPGEPIEVLTVMGCGDFGVDTQSLQQPSLTAWAKMLFGIACASRAHAPFPNPCPCQLPCRRSALVCYRLSSDLIEDVAEHSAANGYFNLAPGSYSRISLPFWAESSEYAFDMAEKDKTKTLEFERGAARLLESGEAKKQLEVLAKKLQQA